LLSRLLLGSFLLGFFYRCLLLRGLLFGLFGGGLLSHLLLLGSFLLGFFCGCLLLRCLLLRGLLFDLFGGGLLSRLLLGSFLLCLFGS
jgi:hypothetical protein